MSEQAREIDYSKPVYLHYKFEKFWEIKIDLRNSKCVIRQGNLLKNGEENVQTLKVQDKTYTSFKEAIQFTKEQVNLNLQKGFEVFNKQNLQTLLDKENAQEPLAEVGNGAEKSRGVKRRQGEMLPVEDAKMVKKSLSANEMDLNSEDSASVIEEPPAGANGGFFGFFKKMLPAKKNEKAFKKVVPISSQLKAKISEVEQKCTELDVRCRVYEETVVLSGDQDKVQAVEDFIIASEEELAKMAISEEDNTGMKREILLSNFLKNFTHQIREKAQELKIACDYVDPKLTVVGPSEAVTELLAYLLQLEAMPTREKFEKKEFEEFAAKELELNRHTNEGIGDIRKKVDDMSTKMSTEEAMQREFNKINKTMIEGLGEIKAKIESMEMKKIQEFKELSQEENKKNLLVNNYLTEIKKKVESMESKLNVPQIGAAEMSGSDREIIKGMNDNLAEIKKKVGDLELKMEVDTDGLMEEEMKVQKILTDNFGALSKKVDAVEIKMDVNSGDFAQKDTKIQIIHDSLSDIVKKVGNLEKKIDSQMKGSPVASANVDLEKFADSIMKLIDQKLSQKAAAAVAVAENSLPRINASQPAREVPRVASQIPQMPIENNDAEEFAQKEISISVYHRSIKKDIEKKADELGLIYDFGYDIMLTSGTPQSIDKFIVYLQDCELKIKKSLYPKYWDFLESRDFALINVPPNSEEFKEASSLFNTAAKQYRILKLERIQNKYLLDHYISNVQKRKEFRSDAPLQRMLLFHGTALKNPETIYKNSDVGFDLQFAESKGLGRGIYFTKSPLSGLFSHQTPYKTETGTFKILIADVLVGHPKYCGGIGGNYMKAPEGFDSVTEDGTSYVIFNNFHSYPLYLLEYN